MSACEDVVKVPIICVGLRRRYRCDAKTVKRLPFSNQVEEDGVEKECHKVMHVPEELRRAFLSAGAKVQADLNCTIEVSEKGATDFVVSACSESTVSSACTRLSLRLQHSRRRRPFTHFISINLSDIGGRLNDFKTNVLIVGRNSGKTYGENLFQKAERFHLTLCALVLLDQHEIDSAACILSKLPKKLLKSLAGCELHVTGLEIMNDDPECVDVLYAKVWPGKGASALQEIAQELYGQMTEAGFCVDQKTINCGAVKLHATVMNSLFGREDDTRRTFDASEILSSLANFSFGTVTVGKILLSKRHHFDAQTGYYKTEAFVSV